MSPSYKPVPKVQTAGISGALGLVAVFVASQYGFDLPGHVAAAAVLIITSLAGYIQPDYDKAALRTRVQYLEKKINNAKAEPAKK